MKSVRFYKSIIAILVILNLATLAFFWWNKPLHHGLPTPIVEIIQFDASTKSKIEKLEKEHHLKKRALIEEARNLEENLYLLHVGSEEELTKKMDALQSKEREIHLMTVHFFQEIDALCNGEQRKELEDIKKGAIQRMGKPPHSPK